MSETEARNAIIVVDVQRTFCNGGALPVFAGDDVAENVATLLAGDHGYDFVVTTQDWHIDPGDHFSDKPDYVNTWPPHGVAGTDEADLHPALAPVLDRIDSCVRKGMYAAAYSGFEGIDDQQRPLDTILRRAGITAVDVVGLAYDHCVRATALDAKANGYETRVLAGYTASVAAETELTTNEHLAEAEIPVV